MTIGKSLIKHFAKPPALKKISNPFCRPFTITKTKKPYMIADIPLMNQKQSIADLEIETWYQNPNSNLESQNLNWIHYKSKKLKPKPRTQNQIYYRSKKPKSKPKPRTQILNQSIIDCRAQILDLSIWSQNSELIAQFLRIELDVKCSNSQLKYHTLDYTCKTLWQISMLHAGTETSWSYKYI